ncbi:bifunctional metallophosphatase/5'-nucleotidase [Thermus thermamylovorans]|uniref:Multifunctional 2',3'-cyclic-nucleotide 2'-phosphodiesterase/5'-nucleotidase/3'-nucleotidase n=1 Tax=Thermus thermamylovorans TaxID=2509362 RepID=A0A4Q9B4Y7_9DEIN|nr:5'-nucleotidase C-terminal domain-containing protein [Thermus thermamylovorans]TBH20716.1 multifunctional 2',3'-cyclic-nucleotide 2'-phosphodiesterase/5'-nucleotidase/3'-nucleotidase [Thermus thermamylovorans]
MKRRALLKAGAAWGVLGLGLGRAQGAFTLTLVHTNDTHAHLEPTELTLSGQRVRVGGVAQRIAFFDRLRTARRNVLFLDAGDVFQGTLYFNQYRGLADRFFMHRALYRVMALGNHEFNLGPGHLAEFVRGARFQVVSANLGLEREPRLKGLVAPFAVVSVGGERVGVVGLTTPDTAVISNPGPTVDFLDPYESAQKAVYELLRRGVNKIVVLSHLGYGEDLRLARRLVGAQVIVGGHSHTLLGSFPHRELSPAGPYPTVVKNPEGKDVLVVQAWEWGKVVGVLELAFDARGELVAYKGEPFLMTPEVSPEDFFAREALLAYAAPVRALMGQVVAEARVDLVGEREVVRRRESNLGNLIADGMLWKTRGAGTQIALQNGGGIRASIPRGPITVAKVYEVLPFGNTLVVMDLKGREIKAALENGVSQWEGTAGRFLQVAGLRYAFDLSRPAGDRVVRVEVRTERGFVPLDLEATYRVVVNNFIAAGGDGFAVLRDAQGYRVDTGFADAEAFMEYLGELRAVEVVLEGRIEVLNEPRGRRPAYWAYRVPGWVGA